MNDSVLVSVATVVQQIAQPGTGPAGEEVVGRGPVEPAEPAAEGGDADEIDADDD